MLEQRVVSVTIDKEGKGYSISTGLPRREKDSGNPGETVSGETYPAASDATLPTKGRNRRILYSVRLPQGISIEGDDLTFYPRGESSGGSLVISDNEGRAFRIVVETLSGKVRLAKEA